MPRLIRLGDFRLEAYLDGILLVFTHHDVPGIIGTVGTIFGNHRVNIAQMAVGRTAPGGAAIGVLNLDALPPPAALDEVASHQRHSTASASSSCPPPANCRRGCSNSRLKWDGCPAACRRAGKPDLWKTTAMTAAHNRRAWDEMGGERAAVHAAGAG